ncbi:Fungal transcriptional regulatory protein [Pleurostoma richardsiae]|uniref:Fungal transcriptional regulatory protein n=1 Tax=Pleurostoma richardsiae TaxID=41990 RepID=A0AA38RXT7_9PEZI|nr:Fungal transcriptional regulatory protein [Pleurostoma richardsiae]
MEGTSSSRPAAGSAVLLPSHDRRQQEYSAGAECIAGSRRPYKRRKRHQPDPHDGDSPAPSPHGEISAGPARRPPLGGETPAEDAPVFVSNLWVGLNDDFQDPRAKKTHRDDDDALTSQEDSPFQDPSALLFSTSPRDVSLREYHPPAMNAFMLWQAYLQNVHPLSKVVDAPLVQTQVLEASRDFDSVTRPAAALLFAIYAAAVSSISDEECRRTLGEPKKTLQARYVSACQQALAAAAFMRSQSLAVLQAFVIFLLGVRHIFDPQTFFVLAGVGIRMAQRLKVNAPESDVDESVYAIQMRRRIWWQLILIDGRSHQLSGNRPMFGNAFNTPLPANLNDADLSPGMTEMPIPHKGATEMIFCLVRYEIGMFLNTNWNTLYSPAVAIEDKDKLIDELEARLAENYIRYCDPAIPLHMLTQGVFRSGINKFRLTVHHPSRYPDKGKSMPQAERDMLFSLAVELTEFHVAGQKYKALQHFSWHMDAYFQLDTLVFMLIESRSQPPLAPLTEKAWHLVDEIYKNHPALIEEDGDSELYIAVGELVLRAWAAREAATQRQNLQQVPVPEIVSRLRDQRAKRTTLGSSVLQQSIPAPGMQDSVAQELDRDVLGAGSALHGQADMASLFDGIFDTFTGESELSEWGVVNWPYWDGLVSRDMVQ